MSPQHLIMPCFLDNVNCCNQQADMLKKKVKITGLHDDSLSQGPGNSIQSQMLVILMTLKHNLFQICQSFRDSCVSVNLGPLGARESERKSPCDLLRRHRHGQLDVHQLCGNIK